MLLLASVAVTLVLDPVLILGLGPVPALGIAGAAIATICTRAVAFVVGLALIGRRGMVRFGRPRSARAGRSLRIGLPTARDRRRLLPDLRRGHAHGDAVRHAGARRARARASRRELAVHGRRRLRRGGGGDRRAEHRGPGGPTAPSAPAGSSRRRSATVPACVGVRRRAARSRSGSPALFSDDPAVIAEARALPAHRRGRRSSACAPRSCSRARSAAPGTRFRRCSRRPCSRRPHPAGDVGGGALGRRGLWWVICAHGAPRAAWR